MANRIAGITVEIGGDTTKLSTALKTVNLEIKSTQSALNDVNKLLKLDPGNTELLAQKHKLLAQAVSETKDKLAQLKEAAQQANQQLANGEISQAQYDALQREIIETESKLKSLEEQAGKSAVAVQKIAETGEKMKTLGDNISGVGTSLTKSVTVPVLALGTAAVKTAADFDSAMSQVAAVSGATGEEFNALRDKAREMGAKTKFSASEAAEAMNYMAMAGWKSGDMLDGISGIMNLAAASGEDLATTSDIVTDALTAFGLTASDAGHFADILAAASSNANTNVSMMGETFKYCAPVAGALGFSAEDTAEAIGLMANAGIKSSQAGTALRTIMTNLTGDIDLSGRAFGDVTVKTTNADGSMRSLGDILQDLRGYFGKMTESEAAASAEALVGKNAMSGFLAVMNAGEGDITKLHTAIATCSDTIDGYNGTCEKMAAVMQDNLEGQLTILKSQLQELAISIGDVLVPVIRDIVSFIQKVVDKLNGMDEGTRKFIITAALVVAAVGPILIVVGKIITAIGTIMTLTPAIAGGISAVTGAFGALNAVMLANPIGLVIAAVAALIAIFVLLWNNCDGFREFWINLWQGIKDFFCQIWEGITFVFSGVVNFIKENWQAMVLFMINPIAGLFKYLWDNCEGFREFWINLWNGIKEFFSSVWEGIKSFFASAWEGMKNIVSGAWEGIKSITSNAVSAVGSFISNTWNSIKSHTSETWSNIKSGIGSAWDNIKSGTSTALSNIKSGVSDAWNSIKTNTSSTWESMKSGISDAWSSIKENVSSATSNIKETLSGAWTSIKENTTTLWNNMKESISSIGNSIKENVSNLWENIKSGTSAFHDKMKDITSSGLDAMKSFYDSFSEKLTSGVNSMWENVKSVFSSATENIKNTFSDAWTNIKSTAETITSSIKSTISSGMEHMKSTISTGLSNVWNGIQNAASNVGNCIGNVVENIKNAFSNLASNAWNWGADLIGNLISGIGSMIGRLVDKVKDIAGTIASYLHFSEPDVGPLSNFHTFMPDMIKLMGEGIENNLSTLKAPMNSLASTLVPTTGKVEYETRGVGGNGSSVNVDALTNAVLKYLPKMANTQIVLDSGALVGELSDGMNRQLGKAYL